MASIKNDTGWAVVTSTKKVKEKSEQLKTDGFGTKTGNKRAKTDEQPAKPVRNSRRRGGSGRKNKASLAGPNKTAASANAKNDSDIVSRSLRKKMQNLSIKSLPPTPPGNQQQPRNSRGPLAKKSPVSPELPPRSCSSKPSNRCSSVFQSSTTTSEFSWSSSVYNYESFSASPQLSAVQLPHFVGSEVVASHFDNRVLDISPIVNMSNGCNSMYSIPEQLGGKFGAIGEERKRKLSLKSGGTQFDNNCCAAMDSKSVGSYDSGFSSYHYQPFQL